MTDHAPYLERIFDLDPAEGAGDLDAIEGELPEWLSGSYYVNGPGRFRHGALAYRHWLDGDGRVSALAFGTGGVRFTSRFVRSVKRTGEEAENRPLYRTFGTSFPGDQLLYGAALASPVNVSVYRFAGRLLAFGEQGLPWALDPATLDTLGEHDFGRLNPVTPFSAHPHFCPETGEMFNFGISYAANRPTLQLFRFDAGGGFVSRRRIPLERPYSLHDFSLSRRHAVFFLAPYLLEMEAFLSEGTTVQDALTWRPELGTTLLVVDRESGETVASLPVGDGYCLHQINCHEEEGRLTVDLLELPEPYYPQYQVVPDLFERVVPASPVRLVVDLTSGGLVSRTRARFPWAADFPSIDPRRTAAPYDEFWMLAISKTGPVGRKFFDRLVRFDWRQGRSADVYEAPLGRYLGGEPVFVPQPGREDAGVVICQEVDAAERRGWFLLFDAHRLAGGPLVRIELPEPIHLGFHASYAPAEDG